MLHFLEKIYEYGNNMPFVSLFIYFFNGRHRAVCSWNVSLSRLFRWFIFEWKLDPQAVGWTTKFRESFDSKN